MLSSARAQLQRTWVGLGVLVALAAVQLTLKLVTDRHSMERTVGTAIVVALFVSLATLRAWDRRKSG